MTKIGTDIAHAAARLKRGQLVAMPTETVYGLAASAADDEAIARIYQAKGRPSHNPLIIHVSSLAQAKSLVQWNQLADKLSAAFWPGPLTLVLPRQPHCAVSGLVSSGLDTLAIRMPAHPMAQQLIAAFGKPVAAPSANRSGHVTATNAQHVAADFAGQDVYILEAGASAIGLESAVVDVCSTPRLLRPGSITAEQLSAALQLELLRAQSNNHNPASPGMLSSHYAPRASLRLNAQSVEPHEALLAFGAPLEGDCAMFINLSPTANLEEASANLFAALRQLDAMGAEHIAVMPLPSSGLGEALNDRLKRAAAPRD